MKTRDLATYPEAVAKPGVHQGNFGPDDQEQDYFLSHWDDDLGECLPTSSDKKDLPGPPRTSFTLADFLQKQAIRSCQPTLPPPAKMNRTRNRNFKGKCVYSPQSDVQSQLEEPAIYIESVSELPAAVLVRLPDWDGSSPPPAGWVSLVPRSTPPRLALVQDQLGILVLLHHLHNDGDDLRALRGPEEYMLRIINFKPDKAGNSDMRLHQEQFDDLTSLEAVCQQAEALCRSNRRLNSTRSETAAYTFLSLSDSLRLVMDGSEDQQHQLAQDWQLELGICGICFSEYHPFYRLTAMRECGHSYCDSCWALYLSMRLNTAEEEGTTVLLTCPSCDIRLDLATVAWFVPATRLLTYFTAAMAARLARDPDLTACPKLNCSRLIRLRKVPIPSSPRTGGSRRVECLCGLSWCVDCRQAAHDPATCRDHLEYLAYTRKIAENAKLETEVYVRTCPSCGTRWEKQYGCNHLVCGHCATSFCWGCGESGHETTGVYCSKMKQKLETVSLVPEPTEFFSAARIRAFKLVNELKDLQQQRVGPHLQVNWMAVHTLIRRFLAADRRQNFQRIMKTAIGDEGELAGGDSQLEAVQRVVQRALATATRGGQLAVMSILSTGGSAGRTGRAVLAFQMGMDILCELRSARLRADNWAAVLQHIDRKTDNVVKALGLK
jgi:hypothetical protein